jgi:hypothetical protein
VRQGYPRKEYEMNMSKKMRELNRARIEHDKSRLMAGFAESRKEMVNMVDAALAGKVEELTQQLANSQDQVTLLRDALDNIKKYADNIDDANNWCEEALAATEPKS